MLTYLKPAALKLRHQSMLTSSSQCTLNVILRRCKMTLVYENARVFVEMMTGGHVRLLTAVPVTYIKTLMSMPSSIRRSDRVSTIVGGRGAAVCAHGGP